MELIEGFIQGIAVDKEREYPVVLLKAEDDEEILPGGRIMRWICKEMRIGGKRKHCARWWKRNKYGKLVKEKFNQFRNTASTGMRTKIIGKCAWLEAYA